MIKLKGKNRIQKKVLLPLAIFLLVPWVSWAGPFDKDPILETQTKAVPATEETIKNSSKGAPAPSYKIMEDTGKFFTERPYRGYKLWESMKWLVRDPNSLSDAEEAQNGIKDKETESFDFLPQDGENMDETEVNSETKTPNF